MDEAGELLARLNGRYGSSYAPAGRIILRKGKLFVYSGPQTNIKGVWQGVHIGSEDLSLTIEGAQKLGTTASENTIEVAQARARAYYDGEDLKGFKGEGPVILTTKGRPIGPGLLKDGKIINILPLSRRTGRSHDNKD